MLREATRSRAPSISPPSHFPPVSHGSTGVYPLLFLLSLYLVTRLCALTSLPIFVDEAIHLRWAMTLFHGGARLALADGRGLPIWLSALTLRVFTDPVFAGRIVSVISGAISVWSIYSIAILLISREAALAGTLFYICSPFTLFYDRIGLQDGTASALGACTLLFSYRLVQCPNMRNAVALSGSMVLAVLSKMTSVVVLLTPLAVTLLLGSLREPRIRRKLLLSYCMALAGFIGPVVYYLSSTTVLGKITGRSTGIGRIVHNTLEATGWLWQYLTAPVFILVLAGVCTALARKRTPILALGCVIGATLGFFCAASQIWFPRYILFVGVPACILAGYAVWYSVDAAAGVPVLAGCSGHKALLTCVASLLLCIPALRVDFYLWTRPWEAPLPDIEVEQYIREWASGYGVEEAADFLKAEARGSHEVLTVLDLEYGTCSFLGLRLLLSKIDNIDVKYWGPGDLELLRGSRKSRGGRLFVVVEDPPVTRESQARIESAGLPASAVLRRKFVKPRSTRSILVYEIVT